MSKSGFRRVMGDLRQGIDDATTAHIVLPSARGDYRVVTRHGRKTLEITDPLLERYVHLTKTGVIDADGEPLGEGAEPEDALPGYDWDSAHSLYRFGGGVIKRHGKIYFDTQEPRNSQGRVDAVRFHDPEAIAIPLKGRYDLEIGEERAQRIPVPGTTVVFSPSEQGPDLDDLVGKARRRIEQLGVARIQFYAPGRPGTPGEDFPDLRYVISLERR